MKETTMDDLKMMAVRLATIFPLAFGAAAVPDLRAQMIGDAQAATGYVCTGHVRECTVEGMAGDFGCPDATGKGADEAAARADGLKSCAAKLRETHGREVVCRDASQMTCGAR
jgi:hypothetical protein